MIKILYEFINDDGTPEGDKYRKIFDTDQEFYKWLRGQDGHPWLCVNIIEEIREEGK